MLKTAPDSFSRCVRQFKMLYQNLIKKDLNLNEYLIYGEDKFQLNYF